MDLSRITPGHIAAAARTDDLDDAVRPLQDLAGITDGGIASLSLSAALWHHARPPDREHMLRNWIEIERLYAEGDVPCALTTTV